MRARRRRKAPVVAASLCVAALLLLPGPAAARAPTLNSVEYGSGALTATWTLPPGVDAFSLEASQSSRLDSDGGFASLDVYVELDEAATQIRVPQRFEREFDLWRFEPGTYYVHVGGSDQDCDSCPDVEYSEIMTVTVPRGPWTDADDVCEAYLPDARSVQRRLGRANTLRQLASALDRAFFLVQDLLGGIEDDLAPPPDPVLERRFGAMLGDAERGGDRYESAADALRSGRISSASRSLRRGVKAFRAAAKRAGALGLADCRRFHDRLRGP